MTIEEFLEILKKYNIESMEGVKIEGDLEIELDMSSPNFLGILTALSQELGMAAYHLARASQLLGYPIQVAVPFAEVPTAPPEELTLAEVPKEVSLIETEFTPSKVEYMGVIQEVTLGAKKGDGGTRKSVVTLGGEKSLPFYLFDSPQKNLPAVTIDVFDMPVPLPKAVREHYGDVMENPAEWAKKAVKEYGADLITIHLVSTDPLIKDTPASEAVKVVEDVLQAVDVPLVIGGSGNKEKDPVVLEKAAEVAEGERMLLASATLDMDWERIAKAAKDFGHVVLSWTQMDINNQKTLNRYLLKRAKLPPERIIMDPTTAALGYGLDYAFTNMERIRLSGLKGDKDLAFPISSGTTNAWGAREAWMKDSPIEDDTSWGPREYRGPLWELVTGLTLSLAGVDLFMMMHPAAVNALKEIISTLCGKVKESISNPDEWITMEG